jgi:ABC-type branched-subunit amino acid transport system substrate-binding protein
VVRTRRASARPLRQPECGAGFLRRGAVRRALAGVGSISPPFDGVTGTIAFDGNGDVPNQNVYIGLVRKGAVQVVEGTDEPEGTQ